MAESIKETPRDVLKAALELHAQHEPPSPREVLRIHIRSICAAEGLHAPDFNHWPSHELPATYLASIDGE